MSVVFGAPFLNEWIFTARASRFKPSNIQLPTTLGRLSQKKTRRRAILHYTLHNQFIYLSIYDVTKPKLFIDHSLLVDSIRAVFRKGLASSLS
jgi:hypothetical protein